MDGESRFISGQYPQNSRFWQESEQARCHPKRFTKKNEPRVARLKVSNREASNRVDRSHSENPDELDTFMKIQPNLLLNG